MDIKKIIQEEINDLEWIDSMDIYDPFKSMFTKQYHRISFPTDYYSLERIKNIMKSLGYRYAEPFEGEDYYNGTKISVMVHRSSFTIVSRTQARLISNITRQVLLIDNPFV